MIEAEIVETDEAPTEVMSAAEARERTDNLKRHLTNAWFELKELYVGSAWVALGFHSWDAYVKSEFGTLQLTPPPAERVAVMVDMRTAGMSNRAIATATGLSVGTVHGNLKNAELTADAPVLGADGKQYAPERPSRQQSQTPVDQWRKDNGLGDLDSGADDSSTLYGVESGVQNRTPDSTGYNKTGDEKRQDILDDALDLDALDNEDPADSLGLKEIEFDPAAKREPKKRPAPSVEAMGVQGELFTISDLTSAGTEVLRLAGLIRLSKADRSEMSTEQYERYRQELLQAMEEINEELDESAEARS